jgi:hypothetical protein
MTPNKRTIETYMDGFRKTDRPQILSCLTDDVEWVIPTFRRGIRCGSSAGDPRDVRLLEEEVAC